MFLISSGIRLKTYLLKKFTNSVLSFEIRLLNLGETTIKNAIIKQSFALPAPKSILYNCGIPSRTLIAGRPTLRAFSSLSLRAILVSMA